MTNRERDRETYESMFYRRKLAGKFIGQINGFPQTTGSWCKKLKERAIRDITKTDIRGFVLQRGTSEESNAFEGGYRRQYGFPTSSRGVSTVRERKSLFGTSQIRGFPQII